MSAAIKLTTFVFRDKFGWTPDRILSEAYNSAVRRAEVMGWSQIKLQESDQQPYKDDIYQCHTFEIWGIGEAIVSNEDSAVAKHGTVIRSAIAAKDAEL